MNDGRGQYPFELERPGLLRGGASILIRPTHREDENLLLEFFGRLSRRTVSNRMLGPVLSMGADATRKHLAQDYVDNLTLVATENHYIIGVVELSRLSERDRATVAVTVQDSHQGLGLGGLLFEHIAAAARDRNIVALEADVLVDNIAMLQVFASSGYRVEFGDSTGSVQHIEVSIAPRRQVITRSDRRERVASRSSLARLFEPRSVVVIGASRTRRTVGNAILVNLMSSFCGSVHVVNHHAGDIEGLQSYASVSDIDKQLDLAVIAVPSSAVETVIAECADVGVRAAVIVTTRSGDGGGEQGRTLAHFARGRGMRLLGPNCMGILNLRPTVDLRATIAPVQPLFGEVSMASQSGPLGMAVLDHASRLGLGFSGFVSLGDSIDVAPHELLSWWEADRTTKVILLHLDNFANSRKFARTARRVAARKPILVVHPDRGRSSSSDFRTSLPDRAVSDLFEQTGLIRVRTMQEMLDAALLLANQPIPPGPRVAIVTNAGSPGALTADACVAAGLVIADLGSTTREQISGALGSSVAVANPLDLTPMAVASDYERVLAAVLSDPGVDSVIVLFVPPLVSDSHGVSAALITASQAAPHKPIVASFLSKSGRLPELTADGICIPSFMFPESAATALGQATTHGDWVRRAAGVVRTPSGEDIARARSLVSAADSGTLPEAESEQLMQYFGLRPFGRTAGGPDTRDVQIEVVDDPIFGPVVSLALSDPYAQLFGDVAFRITPITDRDAHEMVHSLRALPLMDGSATGVQIDVAAVMLAVQAISSMAESLPELTSIRIERYRICEIGTAAGYLDVSINLSVTPPRL